MHFYSPLERGVSLIWINLYPLPPKDALIVPDLVEIAVCIWRRSLKSFYYSFTILLLSYYGNGNSSLFNKLEPLFTKEALCQIWMKEEDFKKFSIMILLCDNYLPMEKVVALYYLIKQIPSTQTCFNCVKFGWNWPSGSEEEDF